MQPKTLEYFQRLNDRIYGKVNRRHYNEERMTSKIGRFLTRLLAASLAGGGSNFRSEYYLPMTLSWSFALANTLGIELQTVGKLRSLNEANATTSTTLDSALIEMANRFGDLQETVLFFAMTHDEKYIAGITTQLYVFVVYLCAVSRFLDLDFEAAMEEQFRRGCPKCNSPECRCGFLPAQLM